MLVCGETRIPAADGGTNEDGTSCWPEETWEEARALCTGAGARLCTVEELQGDETRGTGCMADGWLNWSSDDIGCSAGEHVLVIGSMTASNGAYADQEPRCRDNAEEGGVRCCADVTVGTPCDVATAENLDQVSQRHLPPYFLGHFSPVLRRLFAVPLRFPASWRQYGENGRKMA